MQADGNVVAIGPIQAIPRNNNDLQITRLSLPLPTSLDVNPNYSLTVQGEALAAGSDIAYPVSRSKILGVLRPPVATLLESERDAGQALHVQLSSARFVLPDSGATALLAFPANTVFTATLSGNGFSQDFVVSNADLLPNAEGQAFTLTLPALTRGGSYSLAVSSDTLRNWTTLARFEVRSYSIRLNSNRFVSLS